MSARELPQRCGIRCHLLLAAGWLMLVAGILITPLPLPTGLLMVGAGMAVLLRYSNTARRWLQRLRRRFPALSRRLVALERRLGPAGRDLLRGTDPRRNLAVRAQEQRGG